jgi:hypothetical protein
LLRQQDGTQTEQSFGKLVSLGGLAEGALNHAHLGVEIVDHRNEDRFRRRGVDGGAPFGFTLMREDDVFEAFEESGASLAFMPALRASW